MKASIQLKAIRFPSSVFKVGNYDENPENNRVEIKTDLKVSHSFNVLESPRQFEVQLKLIVDSTDGVHIEVETIANFTTVDDIDDEFINGSFPRINAPAIVYPFVRAYISMLTTNGGYRPILIPAINFEKFRDDKK